MEIICVIVILINAILWVCFIYQWDYDRVNTSLLIIIMFMIVVSGFISKE